MDSAAKPHGINTQLFTFLTPYNTFSDQLQMPHNVLNWRRFFVPEKEKAKHFTGTKKCGGDKTHKGRSPTAFCGT